MTFYARNGYIFVNNGMVGGEEEINYIITSRGHVHHLSQIAVNR